MALAECGVRLAPLLKEECEARQKRLRLGWEPVGWMGGSGASGTGVSRIGQLVFGNQLAIAFQVWASDHEETVRIKRPNELHQSQRHFVRVKVFDVVAGVNRVDRFRRNAIAKWQPEAGHWYTTMTDNSAYWVVPDLLRPDKFHVSRLYSDDIKEDESFFSGTRWTESADRVEIRLRGFHLSVPENAVWRKFKKAGLTEPFGAPENHGKIKVKGKDGQEKWIRDAS
jgi:hypothetical protein